MKNIILGNGLIAKAIAARLIVGGEKVIIISRTIDHPIEGVEYRQHSFSDIVKRPELFTGADNVIQTISTSSPASSMVNICEDVQDNVLLNVRLIDLLVKLDIKKFVFLSSGGSVYGKDAVSAKIPESHATNPISAYGVAKLAVEKYLQLYGYHFGLNYLIIRPSNVYGYIENLKKPQGVINHIINCTLNEKKFSLWGSAENRKDYLYVSDLADAICIALSLQGKYSSTIYNLAYGEGHSIGEIISIVEKITGKKMDLEQVGEARFDVNSIEVDGSLFKKDFNWQPKVNIEQGISNILKQY